MNTYIVSLLFFISITTSLFSGTEQELSDQEKGIAIYRDPRLPQELRFFIKQLVLKSLQHDYNHYFTTGGFGLYFEKIGYEQGGYLTYRLYRRYNTEYDGTSFYDEKNLPDKESWMYSIEELKKNAGKFEKINSFICTNPEILAVSNDDTKHLVVTPYSPGISCNIKEENKDGRSFYLPKERVQSCDLEKVGAAISNSGKYIGFILPHSANSTKKNKFKYEVSIHETDNRGGDKPVKKFVITLSSPTLKNVLKNFVFNEDETELMSLYKAQSENDFIYGEEHTLHFPFRQK